MDQLISDEVTALLVGARRAYPTWGPAKLVQYLAPRHARIAACLPSARSPISCSAMPSWPTQ